MRLGFSASAWASTCASIGRLARRCSTFGKRRLHTRSGTGREDDHGNGRLHASAIFLATKPKLMPQDDGSAASIATLASDARQRIG
jgi:hypothetical protein